MNSVETDLVVKYWTVQKFHLMIHPQMSHRRQTELNPLNLVVHIFGLVSELDLVDRKLELALELDLVDRKFEQVHELELVDHKLERV